MRISGPQRRTPASVAASLERGVPLPDGPGDRYAGYAVLDVRLASRDILALRRFPVTSAGIGYTSVWHRSPEGDWTLFTDVPAPHGCSRHFASMFARIVVTPIRIDWRGPRSLVIEADGGRILKWRLELAASAATALFNAASGMLPWARRSPDSLTRSFLDLALKVGGLRLVKNVPEGIRVHALPQAVWTVNASRARLCGRDLGCLLADMNMQGRVELWRPRRSLFAAGALIVDASQ